MASLAEETKKTEKKLKQKQYASKTLKAYSFYTDLVEWAVTHASDVPGMLRFLQDELIAQGDEKWLTYMFKGQPKSIFQPGTIGFSGIRGKAWATKEKLTLFLEIFLSPSNPFLTPDLKEELELRLRRPPSNRSVESQRPGDQLRQIVLSYEFIL